MKVTVEFLTRQQLDDSADETRFTTVGLLEETEKGLCLRYVEPPDEAAEREGAAVRCVAKDGVIMLERQCPTVHSRMLLEAGVSHPCRYDTLYGGLDLHLVCDSVVNTLTLHGGVVAARYRVETPGADALKTYMEITVKEVSE